MRPSGTSFIATLATAAILIPCSLVAADESADAPPKVKPATENEGHRKRRDYDKSRPDSGRPRRDPSQARSAFHALSEEERGRIRAALQQVWSDPEVVAAKDELQASTERYRETLRTALSKVDPELQDILKKIMMDTPRGPGGSRPSGSRDWGDPNQPGFARSILQRSLQEFSERMKPEVREKFKTAHKAAVEAPAVREALKTIEQAKEPREKMERVRALREAYRAALVEAAPDLAPFVRQFGGSGKRPPGNPPGNKSRPPRPPADEPLPEKETDA